MPFMIAYQPGDLVLVAFPFSTGAQTKNRPALVVLDTGDVSVAVAARSVADWVLEAKGAPD